MFNAIDEKEDILTDEIRVALRRYFGPTTDRDRQLMEESRVLFERWIKSGTEMTFDEWVKLQPESQLPPACQSELDERRMDLSKARVAREAGDKHYAVGQYAESEPYYKQALESYRNLLGEEHLDFAAICYNLGNVYRFLFRYEEAERLLQQALKNRRSSLGQEHLDFAATCDSLGCLYQSLGRNDEAERLLHQALEIRRASNGEEHLDFHASCDKPNYLHRPMDRHDEVRLPQSENHQLVSTVQLKNKHKDTEPSDENFNALLCGIFPQLLHASSQTFGSGFLRHGIGKIHARDSLLGTRDV